MKIVFVTTCRGRVDHVKVTLPENLKALRGTAVIVLLGYNDPELDEYVAENHDLDILSERLVYYRNQEADRFHMAHAKNQAMRCAVREGADILVTLDADNFMGQGFCDYVRSRFENDPTLSFLCPNFKGLPPVDQRFDIRNPFNLRRGFAGRLVIRAQDFLKVGGYNEVFDTWRGEDIDIIARLDRLKFKKGAINSIFLNAVHHSSEVRFKEYPHAKQYENDAIYAQTEKAHDTVVNFGNLGVGVVTRNFVDEEINLAPIATRIFGIGFQRTGTSSLHEAFKQFGFDSAHWKSANWAKAIWQEIHKWGRSGTLEREYAISDNPIPILYDRLDKIYPGSKFVLTIRDEDDWIRSIEKFWTYEGNPQRWVWDEDGFSHKMHGIIYGRIDFDRETMLQRYRQHNAEVIKYFEGRKDFLPLVVHENTSMNELSVFLDTVDHFNQPFPHTNKGPQT